MESPFLQSPSSYYHEFVDPFFLAHDAFFIRAEHLQRYIFAKQFIQKKKLGVVYDVACGDGYGTKMLSSVAKHVHGFDISKELLDVAKSTYSTKNITYVQYDLDSDSFEPLAHSSPDIIVSFETLEHVEDPKKLLVMFFNRLSHKSYLLLSTPNAKLEPKKKGKSRNKFHKNIFEKDELTQLLKDVGFEIEDIYGQSFTNIFFHNMFVRNVMNKITERSYLLFKMFSYIGYPNKLFMNRSYSMIIVAKKKYFCTH